MYRFLMAHSSLMDANFKKGAPEISISLLVNHVFLVAKSKNKRNEGISSSISSCKTKLTFKLHHCLLDYRLKFTYNSKTDQHEVFFKPSQWENTKTILESYNIPCLLSTSISAVNAVPPTVHSSTGALKFPTCIKKLQISENINSTSKFPNSF